MLSAWHAVTERIQSTLAFSERRAGAALGQHRSTQRLTPKERDDEVALPAQIVALAR